MVQTYNFTCVMHNEESQCPAFKCSARRVNKWKVERSSQWTVSAVSEQRATPTPRPVTNGHRRQLSLRWRSYLALQSRKSSHCVATITSMRFQRHHSIQTVTRPRLMAHAIICRTFSCRQFYHQFTVLSPQNPDSQCVPFIAYS